MTLTSTLPIIIQLVVLLVTAVWAVAKIRSTVSSLTLEIAKLDKTLDRLITKVEDHTERIVRLETKVNHQAHVG